MRMHRDEVDVGEGLVGRLLANPPFSADARATLREVLAYPSEWA